MREAKPEKFKEEDTSTPDLSDVGRKKKTPYKRQIN